MAEVEIWHPKWERSVRVPVEMWPGRLERKGWELVDGDPAPDSAPDSAPDPDPIAEPLAEPLDEKVALTDWLVERGVIVDGRWGIKRLRQEKAAREVAAE